MKLIKDWDRVLHRAWSVRLMMLAAILTGAETVSPLLGGLLAPGQLGLVSVVVTTSAFVARFLVQRDLHDET